MAEMDVPETLSLAVRAILWAVFGFIFALVGWEKFWDGQYFAAGVNAALLVIDTLVAVYWHRIAKFMGDRKVTMFYIGLALICALGLGLSLGKIMGRTADISVLEPTTGTDTGRIAWNFDEAAKGLAYFLGFNRQNQEEVRISGFVAHGKNLSSDPITKFNGYIRSDITNEQLPLYLIAHDPTAKSVFDASVPTLPDETFGIPAKADFNITTFNKSVFEGGKDGIPFSQFLQNWGAFTLVLEYDGKIIKRHFSKQEIEGQLEFFERQIDPNKSNLPRVTRRPNAKPSIEPSFAFPPRKGESKD